MFVSRISRPESNRRGMVAVQVALSMTALMAVLALGVDGGLLFAERRHAQATADAAALAAASDLYANWYPTNKGTDPSGTASASALGVASANGYTNDGTTSTVTVNIPPLSGIFTAANLGANSAGYAEVIVTWNQKRGFSAIFGSGTIPISARAVAQGRSVTGGSGSPSILTLGTGNNITENGTPSSITVTDPSGTTGSGGSVYIDSTSGSAVTLSGHPTLSAPYVYAAGSSLPAGVTQTAGSGTPTLNAPQMPDPLSYLPAPSASNAGTGVTVDSTYATSGISGSVNLTSPSNTPTIYIVGGNGINLSGQASVTGNNVMIYLTGANAGISLTGQSSLNLNQTSPLSTGPFAGMTIFQARNDSTGWAVKGNGTLNATGTIYAPAANVIMSGNGGNSASQIIASSITANGNGNAVAYSPTYGQIAATRSFGLVE